MLISLLMENQSKGISLKTVEKVVGDMFSNSVKHIGPIVKKIAIYQAPGRYFFKPEVDAERFLKPAPESERRDKSDLHLVRIVILKSP
ncbi:hypothetical protein P3S67_001866 [Capsicum chacoense]